MALLHKGANSTNSTIDADVIIYDASSGGVLAAVSAARHNASVHLICASWPACFDYGGKRVGGMSSGGLGQTDIGGCSDKVGGFAREFYRLNRARYPNQLASDSPLTMFGETDAAGVAGVAGAVGAAAAAKVYHEAAAACRLPAAGCNETFNLEPHVALEIFTEMLSEAGVTVSYNAQVDTVAKSGTTITSITMTDGTTFTGRVFLDAGYEGTTMFVFEQSFTLEDVSTTRSNDCWLEASTRLV
jgi:hypothetical protein